MRIEIVQSPHWIVGDAEAEMLKNLPPEARKFWRQCLSETGTADAAAICFSYFGEILGFLRVSLQEHYDAQNTLWAMGTWVSTSHQKQGLANQMWGTVIQAFEVCDAHVTYVSESGKKLCYSLQKHYPTVNWWISSYGAGTGANAG